MSRYYANLISNHSTRRDTPVGDDLKTAKEKALALYADDFQDGEIQIYDSHTNGYVAVASRKLSRDHWDNLA